MKSSPLNSTLSELFGPHHIGTFGLETIFLLFKKFSTPEWNRVKNSQITVDPEEIEADISSFSQKTPKLSFPYQFGFQYSYYSLIGVHLNPNWGISAYRTVFEPPPWPTIQ